MEHDGVSSSSSSASSSVLESHGSPQQSPWLQATLSDMDKRMRAMIILLEEDKNSSARTENYAQSRLQLFQMLEEFNNSYCSLAEKYDRLRSKLSNATDSGSGFIPSSSSTSNKTGSDPKLELSGSCLDSGIGYPEVDSDGNNIDFEYMKKLVTELMINDYSLVQHQATSEGNTWSELNFQVTKLMEENLLQQAELAKRNIEKRVMINRLQFQIEQLKGENRDLQSCINCLKGVDKEKQFQTSKLRRMFSGKIFD